MNVDKMRHQLDRASAEAEAQERRQWLASLTPEHRAIHQRPFAMLCPECRDANIRAAAKTMASVAGRMKR